MRPAPTNTRTLFGDRLDDRFIEWVDEHPEVVSEFVRLAREARNRGDKFGAKALTEVMRWTRPDLAPINNSIVSRLARHVMRQWPELDGYFDTRELRGHQ